MKTFLYVETVAIREVEKNRPAIEAVCFDARESASSLRAQTLAGFLCVKKAVVRGLRALDGSIDVHESDILVGHDEFGAPSIPTMPQRRPDGPPAPAVSVSHTREHAWGCAVFGEQGTHG